jgi:hypothetical protein
MEGLDVAAVNRVTVRLNERFVPDRTRMAWSSVGVVSAMVASSSWPARRVPCRLGGPSARPAPE